MNKFALFTDFDGVLIHEECRLHPRKTDCTDATVFTFDKTAVESVTELLQFIKSFGYEPVLVLSTSWIKYVQSSVLLELLSLHFDSEYIDEELSVACSKDIPIRYFRIEDWLGNNQSELSHHGAFFILDDTDSGTALADFRDTLPSEVVNLDQRTMLVDYYHHGDKVFDQYHLEIVKDRILYLENKIRQI
jgi:hypothetical protein